MMAGSFPTPATSGMPTSMPVTMTMTGLDPSVKRMATIASSGHPSMDAPDTGGPQRAHGGQYRYPWTTTKSALLSLPENASAANIATSQWDWSSKDSQTTSGAAGSGLALGARLADVDGDGARAAHAVASAKSVIGIARRASLPMSLCVQQRCVPGGVHVSAEQGV